MTAVLVTLAFLPVYLLIRWPYRRLPLHIDTGYYVSNHTVATGRLSYARGWNARYAGCSKVLPEWLYSIVYVSCRKQDDPGSAYRIRSRSAASLFNYATAVLVGVLAWRLFGTITAYYAGLLLFSVLSSEPHWGVYFECGELFELPAHVVAVICLNEGLLQHSPMWIALAALTWAAAAFFIKLSSAIGFGVLFTAAGLLWPGSWLAILIGAGVAGAAYAAWLRRNGRRVRDLFGPLHGHEASFGQRATLASLAHRLAEKVRRLAGTLSRQPIVPLLALVCIAAVQRPPAIVVAYLAAVFITFLVQATDCWYYQIPLLPPMAVMAAPLANSNVGAVILILAITVWLVHNTVRAYRLDIHGLSDWCWGTALPPVHSRRNLLLQQSAGELRTAVEGDSLLVYGPFTQAYVLAGASYDTPIVTPDHHLDAMDRTWQRELSLRLAVDPPRFVLDTDHCFDAAACQRLGLDYRVDRDFPGEFRLFRLERVAAPTAAAAEVRTYEPHASALPTNADTSPGRLTALLDEVARRGHQRLAIYGAGRFTVRHAAEYRASPVPIVAILDDQRGGRGESLLGWPIHKPEMAEQLGIGAVIVSTDRFQSLLLRQSRRLWDTRVTLYSVDDLSSSSVGFKHAKTNDLQGLASAAAGHA